MNGKKKVLKTLLLFFSLILSFSCMFIQYKTIFNEAHKNLKYEIKTVVYKSGFWHDLSYIHIDNNWSVTATLEDWCDGQGTWDDPFIIENVTINGLNSSSCIMIENSREFFKIKNCTVYNSSKGIDFKGAGIKLINVSNGFLEKNNCSFNQGHGISLIKSYNNTIKNNNFTYNEESGIYLENCTDNKVLDNLATGNAFNPKIFFIMPIGSGIFLHSSDNNTMLRNNLTNNNNFGLLIVESNRNNCSKNTLLFTDSQGENWGKLPLEIASVFSNELMTCV